MRWASNREVFTMMNNRGMGMPTNPEAGPGDTVPAMLTPGEAVIPAPAAQNPMNKPMIQSMINEGRIKNDMQEVPTYEKPPAPSLSIDIIGGMDSKHIFEVYMEKMKQERNQEALNKTMGVPLLMANGGMVPGYENGISEAGAMDYLKDALMAPKRIKDSLFGDTPSLLEQSRIDRGIPPVDIQAEVGLYTQTQEQEMLAKEAEREIKNLQALEQANLANQAKAAELNLIANDPMADPSARRVAAARANQITGTNITPVSQTPPPVPYDVFALKPPAGDTLNISDIFSTGDTQDKTPPDTPTATPFSFKDVFVDAAKEMFDPKALTKAALGYGVTRAMGYDGGLAVKQAAAQYENEQKRQAATEAALAKRKADLTDYQAKKIIDAAYTPPMTPKEARAAELDFQKRLTDNLTETAKAVNRTEGKNGNKTDTAKYNLGNTEQGFAAEIVSEFRKAGVPIYDPSIQDDMDTLINNAYRDMVTYQKETGKQARSIVPFMKNNQLRMLAPSGNALFSLGERDDGTSIQMTPRLTQNVDTIINAKARDLVKKQSDLIKKQSPKKEGFSFDTLDYSTQTAVRARVLEDMRRQFNAFDQDKIKVNKEQTPFYVFATRYYNKK